MDRGNLTKTPFYIGQSSDDVLRVAKVTGRNRLAVEFTTTEGETYHFDLSAVTARERRQRKAAMSTELNDRSIRFDQIAKARYWYADCMLTFEKGRGPKGEGALCYRVTEIDNGSGKG